MSNISVKNRVMLYLYSTKNLVGSALALGGLGLFFGGVINDWWLPIVAGMYAVGWLAIPANQDLVAQVEREMTAADLVGGLDDLIGASASKLPQEAVERLGAIRGMVDDLAPKMFSGTVAMDHAISLHNAVARDLPETVRNYLRLPPAYAALHAVDSGRTCKHLLVEQLDILKDHLGKIADSIYKNDAEALVVNGKFLKEKFHSVSFVG